MDFRKYFLVGLSALVFNSCSTNGEIAEETRKIFSEPRRIVEKDYMVTTEEIPLYERGNVEIKNPNSTLLTIPIKKREASNILEILKTTFPEYSFSADIKTNQLIVRIPNKDEQSQNTEEIYSFINGLDESPAMYRVQASSVRVSAVDLRAFRSSIDLFFETGNIGIALDSKFITERAKSGIEHAVSILPFGEAQIDVFLNGLNRIGYVRDLSVTTLNAQNGESAEVIATQKVQVNKLIPQPNTSIIVPDFYDVKRSLKVSPISLSENRVYLKIEAQEGEVVPSGKELPNINTRTITTSVDLGLGQTLIVGSTLDSRLRGEHEESPLLGGLTSATEKERRRDYVIYFLTPVRLDLSKKSESRAVDELEKQLNNK